MSLMSSLNISASGMTAQRTRMDIIAQNVANVNTTRDENGNPYRRQTVVFEERAINNKNFESYLTAQKNRIILQPANRFRRKDFFHSRRSCDSDEETI